MLPIAQARRKLEATTKQLEEANTKLDTANQRLQEAQDTLNDKTREIINNRTIIYAQDEFATHLVTLNKLFLDTNTAKNELVVATQRYNEATQKLENVRQKLENVRKRLQDALTQIDPSITVTSKEENEKCTLQINLENIPISAKIFIGLVLKYLFNAQQSTIFLYSQDNAEIYTLKYPEETNTENFVINNENTINGEFLRNLKESFFEDLMKQEMNDDSASITHMENYSKLSLAQKYENFVLTQKQPSNHTRQQQNWLATRKQDIISAIKKEYSPYRLSFLGHHHGKRADAVCTAINRAPDMTAIRLILNNQLEIGKNSLVKTPISPELLSSRFSHHTNIKNPIVQNKSGYLKAIQQALEVATTKEIILSSRHTV